MQRSTTAQQKKHLRTVGVSLVKLIPCPDDLQRIRRIVVDVHTATILVSHLINIHIRRMLELPTVQLPTVPSESWLNGAWILKAFYMVTVNGGKSRTLKEDLELRATKDSDFPHVPTIVRGGMLQLLHYNADALATAAHNHIFMHFKRNVCTHVRNMKRLSAEDFKALPRAERWERALELKRMAVDMVRIPGTVHKSRVAANRAWVDEERTTLGIISVMALKHHDWHVDTRGKDIVYYLKQKATALHFLPVLQKMSTAGQAADGKSFTLFPLRRSMVPCHIRFCRTALLQALGKDRTFGDTINLRGAKLRQTHLVVQGFTTDGVCARVNKCIEFTAKAEQGRAALAQQPPRRGFYTIDELRRTSAKLHDFKVIGVDPGKREMVCAMDPEAIKNDRRATAVRYTMAQRLRDRKSVQAMLRTRPPPEVQALETALSTLNSRAASLVDFKAYSEAALASCAARGVFYQKLMHRQQRWLTYKKLQKSEQRLYDRLAGMKRKSDDRTLLLAYGSWGLVAGRPNMVGNKGLPPTIGVGLMRKLALHFVVALTPESWTSKTCCVCEHECGAHPTMRTKKTNREIRGPAA